VSIRIGAACKNAATYAALWHRCIDAIPTPPSFTWWKIRSHTISSCRPVDLPQRFQQQQLQQMVVNNLRELGEDARAQVSSQVHELGCEALPDDLEQSQRVNKAEQVGDVNLCARLNCDFLGQDRQM
jgi:hypothetical protein